MGQDLNKYWNTATMKLASIYIEETGHDSELLQTTASPSKSVTNWVAPLVLAKWLNLAQ